MTEVQGAGISRRRIVQGAAWATPAVLIATAAPALAVSPDPVGSIQVTQKVVGFKQITYTVAVSATDAFNGGFYVNVGANEAITSRTVSGSGWTNANPTVHALPLAAGATTTFNVTLHFGSNNTGSVVASFALFDSDGDLRNSTSG